jgi:hypothetical protein
MVYLYDQISDFCHQQLLRKMRQKISWTDRGKTVYPLPPSGSGGIKKMLPTIWGTYMKLVTKYQISAINSGWEKCDEKWAYMFNVYFNQVSKQEVGIWWVQKRFQRYGVPIWSLWPNIRFLPSIVAEKNVTKNVHICSMCIKTN